MINKKTLYAFVLMAGLLCAIIDASSDSLSNDTSVAAEVLDMSLINSIAMNLLESKTTEEAKAVSDEELERFHFLSALEDVLKEE